MNQPNAVSTALVEIRNTLMSVEMKHRLAAVLGNRIDPEKFAQVAMVAISKNPDLVLADRASLFTSCMECAADALLPNGKDAALVVFNTKVKRGGQDVWEKLVQYLPMVRGIYKVAQRSGAAKMLNARVVRKGDVFHYAYGFEPTLEHVPSNDESAPMISVYAVVIKPDGTRDLEVMTKADVDLVRSRAKSPDSPAWKYHYDEMSKKTVIHRIAKRLDLTPEMQQVIDHVEKDYDFDNEEFNDAPAQVGNGTAPRAEDFSKAEPEPEPEDYELFDEVGELTGAHTARVWVETFQAMLQQFGTAKSLKRLEAAWLANETTRERLAGEGMAEYVTEVRTYYERWKAALAGKPVTETQETKKAAPRQQEPKPASVDPEPAAATTDPVDDDTFPGDRPSASDPSAEQSGEEAPWISTFRSRLPQIKTEKALDSLTKATFGAPLDALAKDNRPKWDELMALAEAQRKHLKRATDGK